MAEVTLEVPAILSDCTAGRRRLSVEAETLADALSSVRVEWPTLATHVFDEAGAIRPHVLVLYNGKATRWGLDPRTPLAQGDRLQIVQAISGG